MLTQLFDTASSTGGTDIYRFIPGNDFDLYFNKLKHAKGSLSFFLRFVAPSDDPSVIQTTNVDRTVIHLSAISDYDDGDNADDDDDDDGNGDDEETDILAQVLLYPAVRVVTVARTSSPETQCIKN